jgi:hypothetical protein
MRWGLLKVRQAKPAHSDEAQCMKWLAGEPGALESQKAGA